MLFKYDECLKQSEPLWLWPAGLVVLVLALRHRSLGNRQLPPVRTNFTRMYWIILLHFVRNKFLFAPNKTKNECKYHWNGLQMWRMLNRMTFCFSSYCVPRCLWHAGLLVLLLALRHRLLGARNLVRLRLSCFAFENFDASSSSACQRKKGNVSWIYIKIVTKNINTIHQNERKGASKGQKCNVNFL